MFWLIFEVFNLHSKQSFYCSECDMFMILKQSIDFLNSFRMITQADNYYGGRDVLKAENSTVNHLLIIILDLFNF